MTDEPTAPPPVDPPGTDTAPPPAEPEPDPTPPGLDEVIEWLLTREPSIMRAKFAEQAMRRIADEVRDPALRYAWEHRKSEATMRDLEAATGINRARIVWALGRHPKTADALD